MVGRAWQLWRGERHEPLDFVFGIDNRLQTDHMVYLARAGLEQRTGLDGPRSFWSARKLLRIHPKNRFAVFSGEHHDTVGARLIAKPLSRGEENEGHDQADHDIVLPSGAWIIPKQKAFHTAHWTTHARTSLSWALS